MRVYAVRDTTLDPLGLVDRRTLGDVLEVALTREAAERFIEDVRADEPQLAEALRVHEMVLRAGSPN